MSYSHSRRTDRSRSRDRRQQRKRYEEREDRRSHKLSDYGDDGEMRNRQNHKDPHSEKRRYSVSKHDSRSSPVRDKDYDRIQRQERYPGEQHDDRGHRDLPDKHRSTSRSADDLTRMDDRNNRRRSYSRERYERSPIRRRKDEQLKSRGDYYRDDLKEVKNHHIKGNGEGDSPARPYSRERSIRGSEVDHMSRKRRDVPHEAVYGDREERRLPRDTISSREFGTNEDRNKHSRYEDSEYVGGDSRSRLERIEDDRRRSHSGTDQRHVLEDWSGIEERSYGKREAKYYDDFDNQQNGEHYQERSHPKEVGYDDRLERRPVDDLKSVSARHNNSHDYEAGGSNLTRRESDERGHSSQQGYDENDVKKLLARRQYLQMIDGERAPEGKHSREGDVDLRLPDTDERQPKEKSFENDLSAQLNKEVDDIVDFLTWYNRKQSDPASDQQEPTASGNSQHIPQQNLPPPSAMSTSNYHYGERMAPGYAPVSNVPATAPQIEAVQQPSRVLTPGSSYILNTFSQIASSSSSASRNVNPSPNVPPPTLPTGTDFHRMMTTPPPNVQALQQQPPGYNNMASQQPPAYNNIASQQPPGYNNMAPQQPPAYNNMASQQPPAYNNMASLQHQPSMYNNTASLQHQPPMYNNMASAPPVGNYNQSTPPSHRPGAPPPMKNTGQDPAVAFQQQQQQALQQLTQQAAIQSLQQQQRFQTPRDTGMNPGELATNAALVAAMIPQFLNPNQNPQIRNNPAVNPMLTRMHPGLMNNMNFPPPQRRPVPPTTQIADTDVLSSAKNPAAVIASAQAALTIASSGGNQMGPMLLSPPDALVRGDKMTEMDSFMDSFTGGMRYDQEDRLSNIDTLTHTSESNRKACFRCQKCNSFFPSDEKRRHHEDFTCTGKYEGAKCGFCWSAFLKFPELVEHVKRHVPVLPYVCCICRLAVMERKAVNSHMIAHITNEDITDHQMLEAVREDELNRDIINEGGYHGYRGPNS